jgi:hypothetical protein
MQALSNIRLDNTGVHQYDTSLNYPLPLSIELSQCYNGFPVCGLVGEYRLFRGADCLLNSEWTQSNNWTVANYEIIHT